jgi:hypothetical protein
VSKPKQRKSKSAEAKALANPLFRQRVVRSAKIYTRKGKTARESGPSAAGHQEAVGRIAPGFTTSGSSQ